MENNYGIGNAIKEYFSRDRKILQRVRMGYSIKDPDRAEYGTVRKYFDMRKNNEYTIDDQTWADLDMDKVYGKLNATYSTPGEQVLYSILRNPLIDQEKLLQRSSMVDMLKENKGVREKLLCVFYRLGRNYHNSFLEMVKNDLVTNKAKFYAYSLIGKVLPIVILAMSILIKPQYLVGLLVLSLANTSISMRETKEIKSSGMSYLRSIIKAGKRLARIKNKEVSAYTNRIREILDEVSGIEKGLRFIGFENAFGGIFEPVSGALLLQESSYYSISHLINEKKEYLMELFYLVGELEAMTAVVHYQHNIKDQYVKPRFIKDVALKIVDGTHPLIENAVPNSIHIDGRDIVLTGTNMSGKSTFLRMLGTNMLLAQTFNFVLAKEYEACFFNIVSSISPNDDVTAGKSFFMAEVESLHRIIKSLEKNVPVFCPIDEIFRGTNPIERISMSAEILLYLNHHNTITIVATHDRELVDILKDKFDFYFFSENVDSSSGLSFDYKLKTGVSQTRNAIKLLEFCNYPEEIVRSSFKRAEGIEGFI